MSHDLWLAILCLMLSRKLLRNIYSSSLFSSIHHGDIVPPNQCDPMRIATAAVSETQYPQLWNFDLTLLSNVTAQVLTNQGLKNYGLSHFLYLLAKRHASMMRLDVARRRAIVISAQDSIEAPGELHNTTLLQIIKGRFTFGNHS